VHTLLEAGLSVVLLVVGSAAGADISTESVNRGIETLRSRCNRDPLFCGEPED